MDRLKIHLGHASAGQMAGIKPVKDRIWLVSACRDPGFFDYETRRTRNAASLCAAKALPVSSE